MYFSITNERGYSVDQAKIKILTTARKKILFYKTFATESVLSEYLKEKYKKNLKQICLDLLKDMRVSLVDDTIIVTFKHDSSDKLASLITYGNEDLKGSFILKNAFYQRW